MAKYTDIEVGNRVPFGPNLLLIHARGARDTGKPLIIFIHGLHGHGFGTWKELLMKDFLREAENFDVGLVNYASGYKRYIQKKQRSLRDVAEHLAVEISQLSARRVLLVGHSMGGLVAKATVRHLDSRFGMPNPHIERVAGVITLGTPSTGSGLAKLLVLLPGPPRRDRAALSRDSSIQREVELFFSTRVDVGLQATQPARLHIPLYSASATEDNAVSPMGAQLGATASQRTILSGSHSGILKSTETASWLEKVTAHLLAPRPRHSLGDAPLTAEFNGSAAHPGWESAFRLAVASFEDENGHGAVQDFSDKDGTRSPDLILRAYSAEESPPVTPSAVHDDVQRQETARRAVFLGISPIGVHADEAVSFLETQIAAPRYRWFRGVPDRDADIVAAFKQFLDLSTGAMRGQPRTFVPLLPSHRTEFLDEF